MLPFLTLFPLQIGTILQLPNYYFLVAEISLIHLGNVWLLTANLLILLLQLNIFYRMLRQQTEIINIFSN